MGLMALKQEFEGAVAEMPRPPALVTMSSKENADPVGEFNRSLRIYQRQIATWRAKALISVERFREICDQASSEDESQIIYLLNDLMPQVIASLDSVEAHVQNTIDNSPLKQKAGVIASLSSNLSRIAKGLDKKAEVALRLQLKYVDDIRAKLFEIIDEYDPDNKPVGDVLKTGDDFSAWFGRIVATK